MTTLFLQLEGTHVVSVCYFQLARDIVFLLLFLMARDIVFFKIIFYFSFKREYIKSGRDTSLSCRAGSSMRKNYKVLSTQAVSALKVSNAA